MSTLDESRTFSASAGAPNKAACPRCGLAVTAKSVQVVSASDIELRDELLSGKLNAVECAGCGAPVRLVSPMLYHDPDAGKAIVFLPEGLSQSHEDQQRTIGSLTNNALEALADGLSSGHLLQPTIFITEESFYEALLIACGVPPESIVKAREVTTLIERLVQIKEPDALGQALADSSYGDDPMVLQLCYEMAERAAASGDGRSAQEYRELGEKLGAFIEPLAPDVNAVIQALSAARDQGQLEMLVQQIRPALDYPFFAAVTELIDSRQTDGDAEAAKSLVTLRSEVLSAIDAVDAVHRQWAEGAGQWVERLLQAEEALRLAMIRIMASAGLLDQMFFSAVDRLRQSDSDQDSQRSAALESLDSVARSSLEDVLDQVRRRDEHSQSSNRGVDTPS